MHRGAAIITGRRNHKHGGSKEYEVESEFSEEATSEIQDPSSTSYLRSPKRKRGKVIRKK
jgi:hypothetical protein